MAREVKAAMSSPKMERGTWPGKDAKVRAAMTPKKEERGKKDNRKTKRAMSR
jgi:hypothetical protein